MSEVVTPNALSTPFVRQDPSHLILALTRPVGSGVSTFTELLKKDGFHRVSLSEGIRAEYRRRHGGIENLLFNEKDNPGWRQELQDIGDEKRKERLVYWLDEALKKSPQNQNLAIDGIQTWGRSVLQTGSRIVSHLPYWRRKTSAGIG